MKNSASYLLDEISGVDDRFIADAEAYRRRKKPRFTAMKIAAAIILCLSAALVNYRLLSQKNSSADITPTLYSVLEANKGKAAVTAADGVTLGKGTLIWSDGDSYYSIKLSESDSGLLADLIGTGKMTDGAEPGSVRVWFCVGDGIIASPELEFSHGNIGYGSLFDYSPEITPSDEFVRWLERLLAQV